MRRAQLAWLPGVLGRKGETSACTSGFLVVSHIGVVCPGAPVHGGNVENDNLWDETKSSALHCGEVRAILDRHEDAVNERERVARAGPMVVSSRPSWKTAQGGAGGGGGGGGSEGGEGGGGGRPSWRVAGGLGNPAGDGNGDGHGGASGGPGGGAPYDLTDRGDRAVSVHSLHYCSSPSDPSGPSNSTNADSEGNGNVDGSISFYLCKISYPPQQCIGNSRCPP